MVVIKQGSSLIEGKDNAVKIPVLLAVYKGLWKK